MYFRPTHHLVSFSREGNPLLVSHARRDLDLREQQQVSVM